MRKTIKLFILGLFLGTGAGYAGSGDLVLNDLEYFEKRGVNCSFTTTSLPEVLMMKRMPESK